MALAHGALGIEHWVLDIKHWAALRIEHSALKRSVCLF
jgi:hypothetical protein